MRTLLLTLAFIFLQIFAASTLFAKPPTGFNEGPFLYVEGGIMQIDFDKDQYDNIKTGDDFEPVFGFIFGWNIWDSFAAELHGRYSTNFNGGKREHIAGADIGGKYFLITDALTNFPSLRIMPTLKAGLAFRIASLPGNPNSSNSTVTHFGWGPAFGCGINFLILKYLSFGINAQEDLIFFDETRQNLTVNGVLLPNTLIYSGGFKPQFSATFSIGVHY